MTNEKISLNAIIREFYTGDVYGQGELEKLTVEKGINGEYVLTARISEEMAMELAANCAVLRYQAKKKEAELNYAAVQKKMFAPYRFEKVDFDFTSPVEEPMSSFDDCDDDCPF